LTLRARAAEETIREQYTALADQAKRIERHSAKVEKLERRLKAEQRSGKKRKKLQKRHRELQRSRAALAHWMKTWSTVKGWRVLAELAERERRLSETRLQTAAASSHEPREAEPGRVEGVRGRSFRPALAPEDLSPIQRGTLKTTYRGTPFRKNPFDIVNYGVLMDRLQPATVIEVGTHAGGSAVWFADQQAVRAIEPCVVSVDVDPPEPIDDRVAFLRGDALALGDVLDHQRLAALPRPWLVVEDSAHLFETSIAVLRFFHPHLRDGDYIVVEDGTLADFPEPVYRRFRDGPNRAVKQFLDEHPDSYEIDAALCDRYGHNVTWAPNAWLRRRGDPGASSDARREARRVPRAEAPEVSLVVHRAGSP
jgi:cephalosporin hydroxylase